MAEETEARELLVPRRTSWRRPATGDAKRDGELGMVNSKEVGLEVDDEVGVAHDDGTWYSLRIMTRVT